MFTLIVKGNEAQARAALDTHKLEAASLVKHERFAECIVAVAATASNADTLQKWFNELSFGAPYPVGALLWYGPRHLAPMEGDLIAKMQKALEGK